MSTPLNYSFVKLETYNREEGTTENVEFYIGGIWDAYDIAYDDSILGDYLDYLFDMLREANIEEYELYVEVTVYTYADEESEGQAEDADDDFLENIENINEDYVDYLTSSTASVVTTVPEW